MKATIIFTQAKGGSGKTTLLTQLAAHWLDAGLSVALVDLDPQGSSLAWAHLRETAARPAQLKLALESADWRAASDLREAQAAADLVLVDTAGHAEALRGLIRDRADLMVIPVQPSMADVLATQATLKTAAAGTTPHFLVLNRCPPRSRAADAARAQLAQTGAPMAETRLGQRAAYAEAFMMGAGVTELPTARRAAQEIRALAGEIAAHLSRSRDI
ncbi:MAG: ParA family protein [Pseudomonadota bacterium]